MANDEKRNWVPANEAEIRGTTFSAAPDRRRKRLVGREARTVTSLHPTGEVRVAGRHFDAVADGCFLEAGQKVRITGTRDFRLVVRRL